MRVIREFLLVVVLVASAAGAQTGPPVRFAGAVNQDGCPFCCEFSCMLTPTPTPEFDGQGRRVFRRSIGQFLFVVEAGLGTSNRNAGSEGVFSGGTVVSITDPSGKPSLMALANRNLGNGSAADRLPDRAARRRARLPGARLQRGSEREHRARRDGLSFRAGAIDHLRVHARQIRQLLLPELGYDPPVLLPGVVRAPSSRSARRPWRCSSATPAATSARATSSSSSSIPMRPRPHRPPRRYQRATQTQTRTRTQTQTRTPTNTSTRTPTNRPHARYRHAHADEYRHPHADEYRAPARPTNTVDPHADRRRTHADAGAGQHHRRDSLLRQRPRTSRTHRSPLPVAPRARPRPSAPGRTRWPTCCPERSRSSRARSAISARRSRSRRSTPRGSCK